MFKRMPGQTLALAETISVNAWQPHDEPLPELRESLRRQLMGQRQKLGSGARAFHTKKTRH